MKNLIDLQIRRLSVVKNVLYRLKYIQVFAITATSFTFLVLLPTLSASASPTITEYSSPPGSLYLSTGSDGKLWYTEGSHGGIASITTSGSVTNYSVPSFNVTTSGITSGPDGALWFTEGKSIGRASTSGSITEYALPSGIGSEKIISGSDGNLWFTGGNNIGRITPSGTVTDYTVPTSDPSTYGIAAGSDGNLWFTEILGNKIGRITPSGTITEYPLPESNEQPSNITAGPDGALWFTEARSNKIGRITTSGSITEYSVPTSNSGLGDITTGPDGALWFTEQSGNNIGRITLSGTVTEYTVPTSEAEPLGITAGPDGALWFTEPGSGKVGRITVPTPSAPTNLSAPSPAQNPSLSWNSVTGATSYNIYRNGTKIDSSTTNSYTDTSAPEGTDSYYVTAVNTAGESSPSNTVNVVVDQTAPTITYTVTPVADSNGYNTGNVLVTFTCTDNSGGSGIASCTSPVTVDNEGIGHVVSGSATDNAGNTSMINVNPSLLNTAINAGGDTEGVFNADSNFTGGTTFSSTTAVDTSNVTSPAPQSVYQTVRYGNTMTYTFPGLTPNSNYTLMLHFNELYWGTPGAGGGGVGSRVFNVAVNGNPALSNYDIYKQAGGANKAITEQVAATADSNGNVTITFTSVTDNAMVSGLELFNGVLPPQVPDNTPPTVTSASIAAGSTTNQGSYVADTDYTGGSTYTSSASVDTSGVTNPAPEAVYQSNRYGNFTYSIPNLTPNTNFLVRLHFNEPYWGLNGNGGTGSRLFNVAINGTQVLNNFDIYATAGGANKALAEDFTATSDANGKITIQFTSIQDNAMVSGIEVEQE